MVGVTERTFLEKRQDSSAGWERPQKALRWERKTIEISSRHFRCANASGG